MAWERAAVGERGRAGGDPVEGPPGGAGGPAGGGRRAGEAAGEAAAGPLPLKQALERPEREIIQRALRACHGSRQAAAAALGINRTTLYKKMKRYGIEE